MQELINNLYPMNACLLGEGYENRLQYLSHLIALDIIESPSGTKLGTWTVPDEWVVKDAWVKFKGEKIIDYQKHSFHLVVGSLPFKGVVNLEELNKHLHYSNEHPEAIPYVFKYYDKDWGFCVAKDDIITSEEVEEKIVEKSKLEEGDYEIFIDTEYRPGIMKLGVHTIPGKSDREILLFAHLDHPFQANDNLSGVACLVDLSKKIKSDYTIKIIFCPETIGSQVYGYTQDISKVDFVIAVDICGNDAPLMLQKAFENEHRINRVAHVALHSMDKSYKKAGFRNTIGSDEYFFNDPLVNIPGLLLTSWPYPEYHTSNDTPDKIFYEKIEETQEIIQKIVEIWEKDFIPVRKFKGPLMRSKYDIQADTKQANLSWDYFFYAMNGKRSLAELCCDYSVSFDTAYETILKLEKDNEISRTTFGQGTKSKIARQKHS